ncbi:MAG: hypothetical protein EPN82_05630 [Bacteroidetes bacterium]|nr:MAG: hypothetical protein EPN82_05630 [Bacteroidota bacterium]
MKNITFDLNCKFDGFGKLKNFESACLKNLEVNSHNLSFFNIFKQYNRLMKENSNKNYKLKFPEWL